MAIKNAVTIDEVISTLNRALESDPRAMYDVFLHRVACNDALADDPTIQVGEYEGFPGTSIGPLGLINGFFGVDEKTGFGAIAAVFEAGIDGPIKLARFGKVDHMNVKPVAYTLDSAYGTGKVIDLSGGAETDTHCGNGWADAGAEKPARTEASGGFEHQADDGVCRVCGCTDDHACPGGCFWVEPGLCSRCDDTVNDVVDLGPAGAGILEAIARWKIRNRAILERQVDVGARVGEDLDDSDVISGGELPQVDSRDLFSPSEIEELGRGRADASVELSSGRENPTGPQYQIEAAAEQAAAELAIISAVSASGGGVTLDGAFDVGGAGAGRLATVDSGSCPATVPEQAAAEKIARAEVHIDLSLSHEPDCDGESPHPDGCDKVDDEENRAPVQGVTSYGGVKNSDIKPAGTISWSEHLKAYEEYSRRFGRDQSANRIAERGGFGWLELIEFLGHEPATWRPR